MTKLNRWFDMVNQGELYSMYTCDSWIIPEDGAEIWCTGWERGQTIKPHGECHIYVGFSLYHCDQLMDILERLEQEGHTWGVDGVKKQRRQQISGRWVTVEVDNI